jgi:L-Ala-D/L-Glu epimerase
VRVVAVSAIDFPVPLIEPFRISRASVDSTRAALVRVRVSDGSHEAEGLGEAALPLGSVEGPAELLADIDAATPRFVGAEVGTLAAVSGALDAAGTAYTTSRAGLCSAVLDAVARLRGEPLYRYLGAPAPLDLETDITLPIADADHLAALATSYRARGFKSFKVKVGASLEDDIRTLTRLAASVPGSGIRMDANMGFDGASAVAIVEAARGLGLVVECFEQPCAKRDYEGMRRVRGTGAPVIADESVASLDDLDALMREEAVDGINLKFIKMGGADRCFQIGRAAKSRGLRLMVGAMIESRLGLTAMAHVAVALGGVDFVDLDTAFLLASDPWRGGMIAEGATLRLPPDAGLGMALATPLL